jgi:hypothetical protein
MERLFRTVTKTDSCWLWTGAMTATGYGRTYYAGRSGRAVHRVFYDLFVGEIPEGYDIDHLCMVRNCVNPDHLEAVTHRENVRRTPNHRAARNLLRTECIRGHAFDRVRKDGARSCTTCERITRQARQSAVSA